MNPVQVSFETLAVSWLVNQIIGWAKRSPLAPWMSEQSAAAARMAALVLTFIGTFGVVVACSGDFQAGWDCRVSIPPAEQLKTFLFRWLGTMSVSHIQYEISAWRRASETGK